MIKQISEKDIIEKFASVIDGLVCDARIEPDNITDSIINNEYFLLLEQNKSKEFLETSFEDIAKKIYHVNCFRTHTSNVVVYWAAIQYMKVFFNCRIPLAQIALLCPLKKMCSRFPLYHEMSEAKLIATFLSEDYQDSILSLLRQKKDLKIKELSYICDIPENTLHHYEKSNENLFKASFFAINGLSRALSADSSLFCVQSKFIPYSMHLWKNTVFLEAFKRNLKSTETLNNRIKGETDFDIIGGYYSGEDLDSVPKGKACLFVHESAVLVTNYGRKPNFTRVNDLVLEKIIDQSINDTLKETRGDLLF